MDNAAIRATLFDVFYYINNFGHSHLIDVFIAIILKFEYLITFRDHFGTFWQGLKSQQNFISF